MQAVILVGGLGSRLRPLTANRPKPMLPIINQPFMLHQLRRLKKYGVTEAILAVQYLAEHFAALLPLADELGLQLRIVEEPEPRGTAGAVKHIADLLTGPCLILNGDTVTDLDLGALLQAHQAKQAALTITLTEVEDPSSGGMVETDPSDRIERFVEKPRPEQVTTNWINAGSYVLDPALLELVPANQFASLERDLFPKLIAEGAAVYAYRSDAYLGDFGTPATYLRVQSDILRGTLSFALPERKITPTIWCDDEASIDPSAQLEGPILIGAGAIIGPEAKITGPAVIGAQVRIEARAQVEGAVVWTGAQVSEGAVVRESILGEGVTIGANSVIEGLSVVADRCQIGADNHLAKGIRLWPNLTIPDEAIAF
jgi:mannose-1-phosphate guanylyltransferase